MALNEEFLEVGSHIIGAAFDVMKNTGRGLREKYYEAALAYELTLRGHDVKRQVTIPATYCGQVIEDAYFADIVVDDKVIIEVKAISKMTETESRQLFTYLKLSGYKLGYLINFGAKDFCIGSSKESFPFKKGIYRLVNNI